MATDRPLGVVDLLAVEDLPVVRDGTHVWYWCRQHEQTEHAHEERRGLGNVPCILIGPFMSEREASRLDARPGNASFGVRGVPPLGMEVEK